MGEPVIRGLSAAAELKHRNRVQHRRHVGGISTTVYDAASNVIATVDQLGHRTTFAYDALDRWTGTVDALGGMTTTVYDAASNVIATVDQLGHRTTFVYDAL